MPFAFPSHQGLIAPLWRRWPDTFDMPALCVGAAMPDVVDGVAGIFRGHLGQTVGHSLLGLALLCVPGGLALWFALHAFARRAPAFASRGFFARAWNEGIAAIRAARPAGPFREYGLRLAACTALGAFSHLFFDLVSHAQFHLLYPWHTGAHIFPAWWYTAWFRVPLPLYKNPYPIGPHFVVWIFLGILGAWMLFRPVLRKRPDGTATEPPA